MLEVMELIGVDGGWRGVEAKGAAPILDAGWLAMTDGASGGRLNAVLSSFFDLGTRTNGASLLP